MISMIGLLRSFDCRTSYPGNLEYKDPNKRLGGDMKVRSMWTGPIAVFCIMLLASLAHAQAAQKPAYSGYKGVMIGTPMADARTKLGNAKDKSDSEDYYVYSDNEACQVL